ncbi:hypothetical protein EE612_024450 [Oryza sativa]|uniref:An-2 n=2 Tax=Oryza sativa TaxID=4530 RepID=A0A0H3WEC4_ORYSI|nr:An-2 [Oryza sativa Indica Group]KAB8096121.1 hypothetical protein EE612_024450 [Oryza sativa]
MMDTDHTEIIKEGEAVVEAMALLSLGSGGYASSAGAARARRRATRTQPLSLARSW